MERQTTPQLLESGQKTRYCRREFVFIRNIGSIQYPICWGRRMPQDSHGCMAQGYAQSHHKIKRKRRNEPCDKLPRGAGMTSHNSAGGRLDIPHAAFKCPGYIFHPYDPSFARLEVAPNTVLHLHTPYAGILVPFLILRRLSHISQLQDV